jgi:hypothetical protein
MQIGNLSQSCYHTIFILTVAETFPLYHHGYASTPIGTAHLVVLVFHIWEGIKCMGISTKAEFEMYVCMCED